MPPLFWLDIAALSISTTIATSLVLVVLGTGPGRALNRSFALFAALEAAWAVFSLLLRLALWLEKGNPLLWSELATLTICLMGPFLLMFTTRYVGHRTRWPDLAAVLGLATIAVLAIPLFHHQLVFNPRLDINGSTIMDLSAWAIVAAVVPAFYLIWSLVIFWKERRRIGEPYLALSVLTLTVGFVVGGVLEIHFPVLSITNTLSVTILGYGVIGQQLFNPLREGTTELQRQIAERVRTEEALRKSEEKYRNLVETSQDSIVIIDLKGDVQFANKATEKLTGYSMEEGVGLNVRKITPPRYWPQSLAMLMKARSGKPIPYFESVIRRKDGTLVPVESGGQAIVEEGQVVGVQIITRDISERKRAEQLLRALNQAATAMEGALTPEEIFTAVAEELKKLGLFCAVLLMDESKSRLLPKHLSYETGVIEAAEKLVGLRVEDFSIPIEAVDIYRDAIWEKKASFAENAAENVMRQVLPEPVKRLAGQIAKLLKIPQSILTPLIVEDEVIGLFSVQSEDLTEEDIPAIMAFAHQMAAAWGKAQLLQDLQNSLEELKRTQAQLVQAQKMQAIGQLAGGIAHDFNNLLTAIGGFTELLLWKAAEGSQQYEDLRQIKLAAQRAADLTRQLRLFTRQEKGEHRPVQLNSVVEEIHNLLQRSIPKEITIELHLEPELWPVEADPSQISQVLMNLCLNARDAMPNGGTLILETRNVSLDEEQAQAILAARPGYYVRLSVSDTGCGMSPEVQARLFEPFFTTKEVGKGTGLGLAVVYGIVRGHDGFINVYSEMGQGSTFRVYLPAIELMVEERKAEELELPTGMETILLVDDEETIRQLGERILEQCGYTVLKAENGVQALEVYQAHRGEIALVVLDVVMPEMSGRECLRRLQEIDPEVKVLISTGYTANGSAQKLVAEGALGVVEKPFLLQDFAIAVRAGLDKA